MCGKFMSYYTVIGQILRQEVKLKKKFGPSECARPKLYKRHVTYVWLVSIGYPQALT